jgi:hypothetical protein
VGEYADMMLDGTCCMECGQVIDYEGGDGVPQRCVECEEFLAARCPKCENTGSMDFKNTQPYVKGKPCPKCGYEEKHVVEA